MSRTYGNIKRSRVQNKQGVVCTFVKALSGENKIILKEASKNKNGANNIYIVDIAASHKGSDKFPYPTIPVDKDAISRRYTGFIFDSQTIQALVSKRDAVGADNVAFVVLTNVEVNEFSKKTDESGLEYMEYTVSNKDRFYIFNKLYLGNKNELFYEGDKKYSVNYNPNSEFSEANVTEFNEFENANVVAISNCPSECLKVNTERTNKLIKMLKQRLSLPRFDEIVDGVKNTSPFNVFIAFRILGRMYDAESYIAGRDKYQRRDILDRSRRIAIYSKREGDTSSPEDTINEPLYKYLRDGLQTLLVNGILDAELDPKAKEKFGDKFVDIHANGFSFDSASEELIDMFLEQNKDIMVDMVFGKSYRAGLGGGTSILANVYKGDSNETARTVQPNFILQNMATFPSKESVEDDAYYTGFWAGRLGYVILSKNQTLLTDPNDPDSEKYTTANDSVILFVNRSNSTREIDLPTVDGVYVGLATHLKLDFQKEVAPFQTKKLYDMLMAVKKPETRNNPSNAWITNRYHALKDSAPVEHSTANIAKDIIDDDDIPF